MPHNKIIEKGHISPEDIEHHTAIHVEAHSTARDSCGNGTSLFKNLNPKIRWTSFPVPVFIDNTNGEVSTDDFTKVIIDALVEWGQHYNVSQFFKLVNSRAEAKMTIGWKQLDGASNTVAVCEYSWNSSNSITKADISFDTSENWTIMDHEVCGSTGNAFDIQSVLTHEIGHGVGFDHNSDPLSCMYSSVRFGETLRRTLSTGDQKGFVELYEITPTPTPIPTPTPQPQPSSPLAKILTSGSIKFVDTFYENRSGQFLTIAPIPLDQQQFGKIITISGKSYVYTYFYRTNGVFATLGRIQIS